MPSWQGVNAIYPLDDNADAQITATATDETGNTYVVGSFKGAVSFGGARLVSVGNSKDIFVAKRNSVGGFSWVIPAGGPLDDVPAAVTAHGLDIYLAGRFDSGDSWSSGLVFGGTAATISSAYSGDIFVAKLHDAGTSASFVWAKQAGGSGIDEATAVAVNGASVYVAGTTSSVPVQFGALTLKATINTPGDIFVAKLSDAGLTADFVWVKQAGSPGGDQATALAINGNQVYVAGNFGLFAGPPYNLSGLPVEAKFDNLVLVNAQWSDLFVAKLTDAGPTASFTWAVRAGGNSHDQANALAVNGPNVYVVGDFTSKQADFGSFTLTSPGNGTKVLCVAKLLDAGSTGRFTWAQQVAGTTGGEVWGQALAVSGANLYVAGGCDGATFGAITFPAVNNFNPYVAQLVDDGSTSHFTWARRGTAVGPAYVRALATYQGNVYVGGVYSSVISFDGQAFSGTGIANRFAGFVAALTDNTALASVPPATLASILLVPNPAHGTVDVHLPARSTTTTLVLLEALGRVVRTQAAAPGTTRLDLSGLAPGVYTLCVQAAEGTSTRRLVVE